MYWFKRKYKLVIEVGSWLLFFSFIKILIKEDFLKSVRTSSLQIKRTLTGETLDYSGQYKIIRFYRFNGLEKKFSHNDITLVTQCSINHLHHLVDLVKVWNGPISCSIFVPNLDASVASDAITVLKRCYPKIGYYVTFHLVYPAVHRADTSKKRSWLMFSCDEVVEMLQKYGYENYMVGDLSFPHNVLRNSARTGVMTKYLFLIDIDIVPANGLREKFLEFANKKMLFENSEKKLSAFVVPVFEIKKDGEVPNNKQELLEKLEEGIVRPFHNETCWWCHKAEDIDRWKKFPQRSNDLDVAFEADWDKSWEPFYVAKHNVPMFDERFKQYGFDRIQQVCEMHVAGYKFFVFDNAFLTHRGWKFLGKFYANKDVDNAQNWLLFNYQFKDELLKKYNTNRTCSPLEKFNENSIRKMPQNGKSRIISRFNRPFGVG